MKHYVTRYFFIEGIRGVFLHGFMSFAAVGVIVACLLIMGSFTLLAVNVDEKIMELEQQNEIVAFVDESLSETEARSVGSKISALPNVADRIFVTKDEALEEFRSTLGEYEGLLEGYEENSNLRHRYRIFLVDISEVDETVASIKKISGISDVRVDMSVAKGLVMARRVVEAISLTLIIVLICVSLFIISNTIKLATFDRRDEIGIMRMVGATKSFIRWPFIVEGFLLGMMAAISAFFLQWMLYSWFVKGIIGNIMVVEVIQFVQMWLPIAGIFLLTGFLVGVGGSVLTIRKFLKV